MELIGADLASMNLKGTATHSTWVPVRSASIKWPGRGSRRTRLAGDRAYGGDVVAEGMGGRGAATVDADRARCVRGGARGGSRRLQGSGHYTSGSAVESGITRLAQRLAVGAEPYARCRGGRAWSGRCGRGLDYSDAFWATCCWWARVALVRVSIRRQARR
ncbi:hypothetical protein AGRA3207_005505 [Actinomadura graeca]|uniref:Uncharacterized protein n=1 Tax=Actinomadura graeca TaxID=2750812 RepID=A0ABX8R036_9ACTN|nr:hypothetical protein AGRA3207_005505 [Actinomadura graeca]